MRPVTLGVPGTATKGGSPGKFRALGYVPKGVVTSSKKRLYRRVLPTS